MEPIGNVIKKIVKERNLGSSEDIASKVLQDPDIRSFLQANKDKIDQKMIKNSMTDLYEFYSQKRRPNKVMAGYAPQLFLMVK